LSTSGPKDLREFVILAGTLNTAALLKGAQWLGLRQRRLSPPDPILRRLSKPLTPSFIQSVEEYFTAWIELLDTCARAGSPASRSHRGDDRFAEEAIDVCWSSLGLLFGVAVTSGLLELERELRSESPDLSRRGADVAESGLALLLSHPNFQPLVDYWIQENPANFAHALFLFGSFGTLYSNSGARLEVNIDGAWARTADRVALSLVPLLLRPGLVLEAGRTRPFFAGAHGVLDMAATAGAHVDLVESATVALLAGSQWARESRLPEVAAEFERVARDYVERLLPGDNDWLREALWTTATRTSKRYERATFSLAPTPMGWRPPTEHVQILRGLMQTGEDDTDPGILPQNPTELSASIIRWSAGERRSMEGRRAAALALGQIGLSSSLAPLSAMLEQSDDDDLAEACAAAVEAIETAPAHAGYPELARRWMLDSLLLGLGPLAERAIDDGDSVTP
jgi:hypothetical protein